MPAKTEAKRSQLPPSMQYLSIFNSALFRLLLWKLNTWGSVTCKEWAQLKRSVLRKRSWMGNRVLTSSLKQKHIMGLFPGKKKKEAKTAFRFGVCAHQECRRICFIYPHKAQLVVCGRNGRISTTSQVNGAQSLRGEERHESGGLVLKTKKTLETAELVSLPHAILSEHRVQTAVDWNPSEPCGVEANFPSHYLPLFPHSAPFPLSIPSLPGAPTDWFGECESCPRALPALSPKTQISDTALGLAKYSETSHITHMPMHTPTY